MARSEATSRRLAYYGWAVGSKSSDLALQKAFLCRQFDRCGSMYHLHLSVSFNASDRHYTYHYIDMLLSCKASRSFEPTSALLL